MSPPRVSICMITFNHEKWIGQAIESVLNQSFTDFEIVVSDDISSDSTRAVVAEYAAQDSRVRPAHSVENTGGRNNFARTYKACRGEFLNHLDGDDFFYDTEKLALQVALLDEHPELSGCFAASQEVDLAGKPLGEPKFVRPLKDRYTIVDFARYCMTDSAAMMSRRRFVDGLPPLFFAPPQGDWPLHMLTAEQGDIGYIDRPLSAYRIHPGGIWGARSELQKAECNLACQSAFLSHFSPEVVERIRPAIISHLFSRHKFHLRREQFDAADAILEWIKENHEGTAPMLKMLKARMRHRGARKQLRASQ